tara:strand:- start:5435 stop:6382 length:948 start_codon:yes stop_codon:yes gene_type:complete
MLLKLKDYLSKLLVTNQKKDNVYKMGNLILKQSSCKEDINLKTGVYARSNVDLQTGEEVLCYAGGSLNTTPNQCFVGVALHKKPSGYELCSSQVELLFAETHEHIKSCINPNAMDHLVFYVIFEVNKTGGRFVEAIKESDDGIVDVFRNKNWNAFIGTITDFKNYPVGVINEQPLFVKQNERMVSYQSKVSAPIDVSPFSKSVVSVKSQEESLSKPEQLEKVQATQGKPRTRSDGLMSLPPSRNKASKVDQVNVQTTLDVKPETKDENNTSVKQSPSKPMQAPRARKRRSPSQQFGGQSDYLSDIAEASLFNQTA